MTQNLKRIMASGIMASRGSGRGLPLPRWRTRGRHTRKLQRTGRAETRTSGPGLPPLLGGRGGGGGQAHSTRTSGPGRTWPERGEGAKGQRRPTPTRTEARSR